MANKKNTNHYLFTHGNHFFSYRYLGTHKKRNDDGSVFTVFRVWAPEADNVFVTGDFNDWKETCNMKRSTDDGIWQASVAMDFSNRDMIRYKYLIYTKDKVYVRSDPFALYSEASNGGASYVYELPESDLGDDVWLASRVRNKNRDSALNVYEFDPGTFYRSKDGSFMNYSALSERIAPYAKKMGFTHVKLPVFTKCSGQDDITPGRFSVDSRFGSPQDLLNFVTKMHRYSLGVIFDIPILSFTESDSGINEFDGSYLYEHKPRESDGKLRFFDTGKDEVVSFLISSVVLLIQEYHADGICLDLSLSYSSSDDGYRYKNDSAFIKKLNRVLSDKYPDVITILETGINKSAVTKPLFSGGLGFDYVANNDRSFSPDQMLENGCAADTVFSKRFEESYIQPVTPDPRSFNDRFASHSDKISFYRTYLLFNTCLPGKKSVFSGCEYADFDSRKTADPVNWFNASPELNSKTLLFTSDLNFFYLNSNELWRYDSGWNGFKLLKNEKGFTAFIRYGIGGFVLCVFNFTNKPSNGYTVGIPNPGFYSEVFTTRSSIYGGDGGLSLPIRAKSASCDGLPCSLTVDVPPFTGSVYKSEALIRKY